jgi:hypothetical protein
MCLPPLELSFRLVGFESKAALFSRHEEPVFGHHVPETYADHYWQLIPRNDWYLIVSTATGHALVSRDHAQPFVCTTAHDDQLFQFIADHSPPRPLPAAQQGDGPLGGF